MAQFFFFFVTQSVGLFLNPRFFINHTPHPDMLTHITNDLQQIFTVLYANHTRRIKRVRQVVVTVMRRSEP